MSKKVISTTNAPGAIGPYSQGICAGGFVFTSGQLPIDNKTGEIETADVRKATKHSMDNVGAILENAGSSIANIVKATIFLTDLNDFAAVNEVYAGYFKSEPPARSCIQVAALPKGATVEIEVVAVV